MIHAHHQQLRPRAWILPARTAALPAPAHRSRLPAAGRLLRFMLTGGLAGLLQIALLTIFADQGWSSLPAIIVAALLGAQLNFVLSSLITWRDRPGAALWQRWLLYHGSIAGTMALNVIVVTLLRACVPTVAASAAGILAGGIGNFLLGDHLVFRAYASASMPMATPRKSRHAALAYGAYHGLVTVLSIFCRNTVTALSQFRSSLRSEEKSNGIHEMRNPNTTTRSVRPMVPLGRPIAAAALIIAGGLADHVVATGATTATTSAASATSSSASASAAVSASSLDAATEHAFAIAGPSVVYVNNVNVGSGSGVIYDSKGDIVTNAHVVDQAQQITVTLSTGKTYAAKLLGTDAADDLAVIHINATGLPAATFAASTQVAQEVLAIGNPLDLQQTVTSGLISALGRTVQESNGAYLPNAIQTSAPINPGNSGGALVNLSGQVVGIPTLEATDPQNNNGGAAQGIGFAIPSSRITYIVPQIIASGTVAHTGRAYLGLSALDSSQLSSGGYGQGGYGQGGFGGGTYGQGGGTIQTPTVAGAVVQQVASGSPAAQAGMQVGDVITAANGAPVSGEDDLLAALAKAKPGATMTLTINRNGSTMTVKVTLGELSAS
jgi:S1-C subfamily serine protease/putative flippase GtrA